MTDAASGDAAIPLRLDILERADGRSDRVLITVAGDLDLHSAPDLLALARSALDDAPSGLRISIADATFVDSGALRALLEIQEIVTRMGIPLVVCDVPSRVRRLLDMTGLAHLIEVD